MFNNDWETVLKKEFDKEYFKDLIKFIEKEYDSFTIYPKKKDIFSAYNLCSFSDTRVVIVGQDPYHNINQAHGLAFSVLNGNKIPPSLRNIYKELYDDLGIELSSKTDLTKWAKQGMLLINTILTVKEHEPLSHKNIGWEVFFQAVIEKLNDSTNKIIFVLWGNNAIKIRGLIDEEKHIVLSSSHPSPLSARHSFFGSKVFSKVNKLLELNGDKVIDFDLEN